MENLFTPYELALKLKELGFNEECLAYYNTNSKLKYSTDNSYSNFKFKAPLWQQAFDWFRGKGYNCMIELIDNSRNYYWDFTIQDSNDRDYNDVDLTDSVVNRWYKKKYKTYEEARLECVNEVIVLYTKYLNR